MKGMVNKTTFQEIELPIPPLNLQEAYSSKFKKLIELKRTLIKSEKKLNNLFNALLQKAFKGELNFSETQEPLLAAEEGQGYEV